MCVCVCLIRSNRSGIIALLQLCRDVLADFLAFPSLVCCSKTCLCTLSRVGWWEMQYFQQCLQQCEPLKHTVGHLVLSLVYCLRSKLIDRLINNCKNEIDFSQLKYAFGQF